MSSLIIHPKDKTTDFLKPIYAQIPIKNKTIITGGVTKSELRKLIQFHDRVMMLGHGTNFGLLAVGQFPKSGNYIIDYTFSDLLSQKKDNIYIWCYANQFVERNGLKGFFSGMFISEPAEAFSNGYYIPNTKFIDESNELFTETVSKYINEPLEIMFQNVLREYKILAKKNPIAQFNLERLFLSELKRNSVDSLI